MKLIKKLFNWFRRTQKEDSVPKSTYDDILQTAEALQQLVDWYDMAVEDIRNGNVEYIIEDTIHDSFLVSSVTKDDREHCVGFNIKEFPYTEETKEYARICAEELCEMLNDTP